MDWDYEEIRENNQNFSKLVNCLLKIKELFYNHV